MLAGLMFLLFVFRVMQQARMNPRFSLLRFLHARALVRIPGCESACMRICCVLEGFLAHDLRRADTQQCTALLRVSVCSESIDLMKYRLLNFAIVLFLFIIMFTNMAVIMFGDKVRVLSACVPVSRKLREVASVTRAHEGACN